MKFGDLDTRMRVFESNLDQTILPGIYVVARIDGRSFTKLTKRCKFEKPYDEHFSNYMVETVKHLMGCGFKVSYGYTQSDEISLLFDLHIDTFNRKVRKFNSVLAGEASAKFSSLINDVGAFDCRISLLPSYTDVIDYFRWRIEDANRNCLSSFCYYRLLRDGKSPKAAASALHKKPVSWKNEFLFQKGVNYNDLHLWKKRGVGVYPEIYSKLGKNPLTEEVTHTNRTKLVVNWNLLTGDMYSDFILDLLLKGDSEQ